MAFQQSRRIKLNARSWEMAIVLQTTPIAVLPFLGEKNVTGILKSLLIT